MISVRSHTANKVIARSLTVLLAVALIVLQPSWSIAMAASASEWNGPAGEAVHTSHVHDVGDVAEQASEGECQSPGCDDQRGHMEACQGVCWAFCSYSALPTDEPVSHALNRPVSVPFDVHPATAAAVVPELQPPRSAISSTI